MFRFFLIIIICNHNLDIVEMEEEAPAVSVNNLRLMYQGCMNTVAIEAQGLDRVLSQVGNPASGWPMIQDGWTGER